MKIKSINFKIIAAMTSALAVLGALLFLNGLQDKTSAAKEEAPFLCKKHIITKITTYKIIFVE